MTAIPHSSPSSSHLWLSIIVAPLLLLLLAVHADGRSLRCDETIADIHQPGTEWQRETCRWLLHTIDLQQQVFEEISHFTNTVTVIKSLAHAIDYGEHSTLDSLLFFMATHLARVSFSPNRVLRLVLIRECLVSQLPSTLANLQKLESLDMQQCLIGGTVDLGQLLRNPELLAVHLEGNRIADLQLVPHPDDAGMKSKIRHLAFTNNAIRTLNLSVLAPFTLLEDLWARNNSMQAVVGQVYLPSLTNLNLEVNNLLTLDLDSSHLAALSRILISSNSLHNLPVSSSSTALKELHMSFNNFDTLNLTTLTQMTALVTLELTGNAIASLTPTDQAVTLPQLEQLHLSYNRLEALNFDLWHLPRLSYLHVSGNPLRHLGDLFGQFPMLRLLHCFQMTLECDWVKRHLSRIADNTITVTSSMACTGVCVHIKNKYIQCIRSDV